VQFELIFQPNLPDIKADEYRIGQVLINLAVNALKYTPAGGKVCVEVKQKGENILFSVSDSGIGIPEEHIPHLFTRFYRVDKSRSREGGGSGIGLTIAQRLVEAHSGNIWAESPGTNQGSTFYFTLPVYKE
jgi:histidine kinase